MSEPLVIVGNGMAAARLCEELAQRALGRYAVAVIGEEPRLAYNRVLLSSVLAGEIAAPRCYRRLDLARASQRVRACNQGPCPSSHDCFSPGDMVCQS